MNRGFTDDDGRFEIPPDLVIFDCDGVLVDSEPIANRVMAEAITEQGWPLTTAACLRRFKGHHFDDVIAAVQENIGRALPEAWLADVRLRTAAAFERELEPVDGIRTVIAALAHSGVATCVASQGPPEKMAVSLTVTGLLPHFEGRIFSAYQVARGKPHPDLFLHAARNMRCAPAGCVVIEDSPLGVQAARAAGMDVFAYDPTGDDGLLRTEDIKVFKDMRALPGLLSVLWY